MLEYLKTFQKMKEVGKYTTECLDELSNFIKPGIITEAINQFVKAYGEKHNIQNSQYQYVFHGLKFPAYCCISVDDAMCHGIPSPKEVLKEGQIVKVDITFNKDGYHGDACRTYEILPVSETADHLVDVAENALKIGMQQVAPGTKIGNIGLAIEEYVRHNKMHVSKDYVGHGIGTIFHTFPQISHFNDPHNKDGLIRMYPGLMFTIEPIICAGRAKSKVKKDGWKIVTKDHSLAAQFEATIGVTENGCEIFCS